MNKEIEKLSEESTETREFTEDEINVIVAKEFTKLNKNGDKYLDIKDLCLAIYEHYKSKK